MSLLKNLKSEGTQEQEDRLGGFQRLKTDLYPGKVKLAYITKSDGGAMAVNLTFDVNGKEYREPAIWITNKNGENFYYAKDDTAKKTKHQLPGFNLVNNLCRLALDGKELAELDTEDKTIKVYDPTEKKEINKSMPCITELHGAEVLLAIEEILENKQEKNDQTGQYEPVADTREVNQIAHVFHLETMASMSEIKEEKPFGEFAKAWKEKYEGQVRDARKIKDGQAAPKSGRPSSSGGSAPASSGEKKTSSLFNRNK
jgi:hypothetical protein